VLAAAALAAAPIGALSREQPFPSKPVKALAIRAAAADDIGAMVELLLEGAEERRALNPLLWPLASDARDRIEHAIRAGLDPPDRAPRELWRLAEASGRIVGITHSMIVPVPPIYDVKQAPGLLLDDCVIARGAPRGTAEALVAATEAALRDAGAGAMIASCTAAGVFRSLYERRGYEPVTLYLAKSGFQDRPRAGEVRSARTEDVGAISGLGARHRRTLAQLNPRFWPVHPQGDSRWEGFLKYMMTLKDREVLVAEGADGLHGYVVPQPISPVLIPAGHDIGQVGVIDDYYDLDYADVAKLAAGGRTAAQLLAAAETAFAERRVSAALAVCPAAWTSKGALLEREGYRTAKLWLFKA
jgi:hypothetical protein